MLVWDKQLWLQNVLTIAVELIIQPFGPHQWLGGIFWSILPTALLALADVVSGLLVVAVAANTALSALACWKWVPVMETIHTAKPPCVSKWTQ